jgi:hypothetical protein
LKLLPLIIDQQSSLDGTNIETRQHRWASRSIAPALNSNNENYLNFENDFGLENRATDALLQYLTKALLLLRALFVKSFFNLACLVTAVLNCSLKDVAEPECVHAK